MTPNIFAQFNKHPERQVQAALALAAIKNRDERLGIAECLETKINFNLQQCHANPAQWEHYYDRAIILIRRRQAALAIAADWHREVEYLLFGDLETEGS